MLTVRDGKIVEVEVYFGWNVPHPAPSGGFVEDAPQVVRHRKAHYSTTTTTGRERGSGDLRDKFGASLRSWVSTRRSMR